MLNFVRRAAETKSQARRLCAGLMERARAPVFFTGLCVPDTMDGRFDLVALHAWLVLDRLASEPEPALSQALIDEIFVGFDEALRQLGTGDIGMNRRLKAMAEAFYGRLQAYRAAATDLEELATAIRRNLYRGMGADRAEALTMATYAFAARSHLAKANVAEGRLDFGPLPDRGAR
jgi:cytochrome b pre-mRNA-processing protein 3